MNIDKVLEYVPTNHGEHGVDSVIHRVIEKQGQLFEAYSNPPGASWASINIKHPTLNQFYSWDQIPRAPTKAKRPDSIIQHNHNGNIELLAIESKEVISQLYSDMDTLLKAFFRGHSKFNGLFNRPTQHCKDNSDDWKFIGNDPIYDSMWIQKSQKQIKLYSGFAFAFEPEYYSDITKFDKQSWTSKIDEIIIENNLDIVIGIGWKDKFHEPFIIMNGSNSFATTEFYLELSNGFSPLKI